MRLLFVRLFFMVVSNSVDVGCREVQLVAATADMDR